MTKYRAEYLPEERPSRETEEAKRRRRKKLQQFLEQMENIFHTMPDEDAQLLFNNSVKANDEEQSTETVIRFEATEEEEEIQIIEDVEPAEEQTTAASLLIEEPEEQPQLWLPGMVLAEIRDGVPVITAEKYNQAFAEAGKYLVPGAGQTFIWRYPKKNGGFGEKVSGYAFSTPAAWWNHTNLFTSERKVYLTELLECSDDQYHHDKAEKASEHEPFNNEDFVALVYAAQKIVYANDQSKWTGKYDVSTRTSVILQNNKVKKAKATEQKWADKSVKQSSLPQFNFTGTGTEHGFIYNTAKSYLQGTMGWITDAMIAELDSKNDADFQKQIRTWYLYLSLKYMNPEPAPEWASKWLAPFHLFWPLMDGVNYGFYSTLYLKSEKINMKSLLKNVITSTTDPDYYSGAMAGILPGIGQWFVDLKDMVVMLVELPGQLFEWIGSLPEKVQSAGNFLSLHKADVLQLFGTLASNPKMASEVFSSFKASIDATLTQALHAAGRSAGKSLGEAMLEFGQKSHYEMGQVAGAMVGYLIPEILLMVFSEGIGTMLKSFAKVAQLTLQSFRLGRAVLEGASVMKIFFKSFISMLRGMGKKLASMSGKALDNMIDFFEGVQKHLGLTDEVAELGAKAETKVDDAAKLLDERPDYAKKADPDVESNAKSKAENEYKDKTDSNKDEKIKVYTEALVITETADAIDKPINTLMADLTALAGRNAKAAVSFKYAPNNIGIGHYKVWMNPPLKDDYTSLTAKEKLDNAKKNAPNEIKEHIRDYKVYPPTEFQFKSLQGKSIKYIRKNKPKGWKELPTRENEGFYWVDENGKERLRFMRAKKDGNVDWERQKNGYFRWSDGLPDSTGNPSIDLSMLDIDGNIIPRTDTDFQFKTHIPYEGLY